MTELTPVDGPGTESRRDLLKRSALRGALIWAAPAIESIRPAPAFAQMSPAGCIILSPESDDKNLQQGSNYCPTPGPTCCGSAYGDAGQVDRFFFANPAPNCTQIVVRTISLDCNAADVNPERNPDVGQFAVIIESTTGAGCGTSTILDAVLVSASGRTIIQSLNNGPVACPGGSGVNASVNCSNPNLGPSTRLAVRLTCQDGCAPI